MDTSRQTVAEVVTKERQTGSTARRERRSVEEKRRIVEETLVEGVSVARVARAHGVNANQLFGWRKLYQAGRMGGSGAIKLLPVRVSESTPSLASAPQSEGSGTSSLSGTIHIELGHARVRIEGRADPVLLRVLMESLRA
jgi:transposase